MLKQLAFIALLLIVAAAVSPAQQTPSSPQVTVIRAGRLVDVDAGRVLVAEAFEQQRLIGSVNQREAVQAGFEQRPPRFR